MRTIGKECLVLLPKYHDERWEELMRSGSSYETYCTRIVQRNYGEWKEEINAIISLIINDLNEQNVNEFG